MYFKHLMSSIAVVSLLGAAGCAGSATQESTGEIVDSAAVSTKVLAKIAKDDEVSVLPIEVNTFKGVVQLSGFVESFSQKVRAAQLTHSVDGVRDVRNDLIVKKDAK